MRGITEKSFRSVLFHIPLLLNNIAALQNITLHERPTNLFVKALILLMHQNVMASSSIWNVVRPNAMQIFGDKQSIKGPQVQPGWKSVIVMQRFSARKILTQTWRSLKRWGDWLIWLIILADTDEFFH